MNEASSKHSRKHCFSCSLKLAIRWTELFPRLPRMEVQCGPIRKETTLGFPRGSRVSTHSCYQSQQLAVLSWSELDLVNYM